MMKYYQNKHILITGASSGIGLEFANQLNDHCIEPGGSTSAPHTVWPTYVRPIPDIRRVFSSSVRENVPALELLELQLPYKFAQESYLNKFCDIVFNSLGFYMGKKNLK